MNINNNYNDKSVVNHSSNDLNIPYNNSNKHNEINSLLENSSNYSHNVVFKNNSNNLQLPKSGNIAGKELHQGQKASNLDERHNNQRWNIINYDEIKLQQNPALANDFQRETQSMREKWMTDPKYRKEFSYFEGINNFRPGNARAQGQESTCAAKSTQEMFDLAGIKISAHNLYLKAGGDKEFQRGVHFEDVANIANKEAGKDILETKIFRKRFGGHIPKKEKEIEGIKLLKTVSSMPMVIGIKTKAGTRHAVFCTPLGNGKFHINDSSGTPTHGASYDADKKWILKNVDQVLKPIDASIYGRK